MISLVGLLISLLLLAPQQRDTPAARNLGSSSITGTVMTDDATPTPVRRAIITATGPSTVSAVSDDEGRFALLGLPPGDFTLKASKAAFVTSAYGAGSAGGAGTPISLRAGVAENVAITLVRGAVLAGIVRDPRGKPISGARVTAINFESAFATGTMSTPTAYTDQLGMYRVFGLTPGDYLVAASTPLVGNGNHRSAPTEAEVDAILADLARRRNGLSSTAGAPQDDRPIPPPPAAVTVPTYFPGTPIVQDASPISVGPGEERDGIDLVAGDFRAGTIEGTITGDPALMPSVQISITPANPMLTSLPGSNPVMLKHPGTPAGSNAFEFGNLAPGRYRIVARGGGAAVPVPASGGVASGGIRIGAPASGPAVDYVYAAADIDVREGARDPLTLVLQPGNAFSGKISFDGAAPPAADLDKIAVLLAMPTGSWMRSSDGTVMGNSLNAGGSAAADADGNFRVIGVAPGTYDVRVRLPASFGSAWTLRSVIVGGRDLLDDQVSFAGSDISGALAVFTDKHTELTGHLLNAAGEAAPGYFVAVFPEDQSLWRRGGRRLRSMRPSSDGSFRFADLPPGTYRVAALTNADGSAWQRPEFLREMLTASATVTVGESGAVKMDLRVR